MGMHALQVSASARACQQRLFALLLSLAALSVKTSLMYSRARRDAAPGPNGPSGYTAEVLHTVLGADDASQLLFEVASVLAPVHVPESAVAER